MTSVNEESLQRANAFLAAVAARATVGELVDLSPAELGKEIGVVEPLAAARAVRALLARRRLEAVDGRYRLLDVSPIEAGEREQVPRPRRSARRQPRQEQPGRATYSEIGREVVERTIELGREVGTLRGQLRAAREEARESREAREESDRRAQQLSVKVKELEARAEMAETNLRTLLAAAKGTGRDATLGDSEMEAILGVLKGEPGETDAPADGVERETADATGAGEPV
jgi:chromosome segregation ATPase